MIIYYEQHLIFRNIQLSCLRYGSTLIVSGSINFVQMMTAMMALMLGALGLGQALSSLGTGHSI